MNESQAIEKPDYEFDVIGQLVIKVPERIAEIIQSVKIGDRVFIETKTSQVQLDMSETKPAIRKLKSQTAKRKKEKKAPPDRPPIGRTIVSSCTVCGKKFQYVYQGRRVGTKCDSCKGGASPKESTPKRAYHRKPKERPTFSASGMKPPNIDEPQDKTITRQLQGKMLDIPLSRRLGTQGD